MKIHEALSQLADFARCGYGDAELFMVNNVMTAGRDGHPAVIHDFQLAHYTVGIDGSIQIRDPSAELPWPTDATICIIAQSPG